MKLKNEDGWWTLELSDKCFIEPKFEWEQLVDKWNWVTFHVVQFEVENDTMTGGCEATVIILGAGFRIRYNYAFEESEAGHQFEEFKKDMENKN